MLCILSVLVAAVWLLHKHASHLLIPGPKDFVEDSQIKLFKPQNDEGVVYS